MINTLLGMVINTTTMRPHLAGVTGGLSGPAIRPVAVRCVWQIRRAFPDLPILGMGGIRSGHDALEFLLAGATAVQVGTANFLRPDAAVQVARGLSAYLAAHGIGTIREIVGTARTRREDGR